MNTLLVDEIDHRGYAIAIWRGDLARADAEHPVTYGTKLIIPVVPPDEPAECMWCGQRVTTWRHPNGIRWFRHYPNEACTRAPTWTAGESPWHADVKDYIARTYNATHRWHATLEQTRSDGTARRRPDVTAVPVHAGRRRLGVERVTTGFEAQASPMTEVEAHARRRDHQQLGVRSTLFLTSHEVHWTTPVADVHLRSDGSVVGVAAVCASDRADRDYLDPLDLDHFMHRMTRTQLVITDDYGLVTLDAWHRYLEDGGIDLSVVKRSHKPTGTGLVLNRACEQPGVSQSPPADTNGHKPTSPQWTQQRMTPDILPPHAPTEWVSYAPALDCPHPINHHDREWGVLVCDLCGGCLGPNYPIRQRTAEALEKARRQTAEDDN